MRQHIILISIIAVLAVISPPSASQAETKDTIKCKPPYVLDKKTGKCVLPEKQ